MMKFQKINVMLLVALTWSNIGFASEGGERVARRSLSPEEPGEEMTDLRAQKEAAKRADYQEELAKHKRNLNLDPNKKYSNDDINDLYNNKKQLGLTKSDGSDEYSQARKFLLDHNRTEQEEATIKEAVRKAARKAARDKQDKQADYSLEKFGDGDSFGDATRLKISSFTEKELSDPNYLTSGMIKNVSLQEIAALDPVKLRALLSNTEAIKALSPEQVQAIPAKALSKAIASNVTIAENFAARFMKRPSDNNPKLPNEFVDKLSPEQAKALIDEHKTWYKTIKHYFTDDQFEHLSRLAKTAGSYSDFEPEKEAEARATTLAKRLATKGELTTNEKSSLKDHIDALNRQQKEAVVSSYADAIAKKSGLTEEKGKWWLFGNKKAESEGKIQTLTNLLKSDVTKMMSDYGIKNDHVMFIIDPKTDAFTIRILNNEEVDEYILHIDPTQPIDKEIAKFIGIKTIITDVKTDSIDYFVDRYTKKFSDVINLEMSPEKEFKIIFTKNNLSPIRNLDQLKSPLKEKIQYTLSEKIITQLKLDPKEVNPEFMKYVSTDQIKALSVDQVKALSIDQVKALTPDQVKALAPKEQTIVNSKLAADKGKSSDRSNIEQKMILNTKPSTIASWRTADALKVSPETWTEMSQTQIDALNFAESAYLGKGKFIDISKLSEESIKNIIPRIEEQETINYLLKKYSTGKTATDIIKALSPEQKENLPNDLSPVQREALNEPKREEPVAPPALPGEATSNQKTFILPKNDTTQAERQSIRDQIVKDIKSFETGETTDINGLEAYLQSIPQRYSNGNNLIFKKDPKNRSELQTFFNNQSQENLEKLQKLVNENETTFNGTIKDLIRTATPKSK